MKQILIFIQSVVLILNLAGPVFASELIEKCENCHGRGGNSQDDRVPSIAGFSFATIEDILYQFKNFERSAYEYTPEKGETSDMQTVAETLSDKDITMLANYFSEKTFIPLRQKFDASRVENGKIIHEKRCEKCHSNGGTNADDDAAILAGQGRRYLEAQFDLISINEREKIPKKMMKRYRKLSGSDIKDLIEYYISQY